MLRNYLTTAWRLMVRKRLYAVINVTGLALALTSCIQLYLYVQHELSYDQSFANADRLYRVISGSSAATSGRLADLIVTSYGEQVPATRKVSQPVTIVGPDGELVREQRIYHVDPSFLQIFSFKGLRGDPRSALAAPDAIVLTERMARKYFPGAEALDSVMDVGGRRCRVTAVIKNPPSNTHLQFDALLPIRTLAPSWFQMPWVVLSASTYLLLPEGISSIGFSEQLNTLASQASGKDLHLGLQPVTDIHLHSDLRNEAPGNSDVGHVILVSGIAVIVLLLACINYVNLSTARFRDRIREVGVRKAIGASHRQLVFQFLGESVLAAAAALVIAGGLVEICLPTTSQFLDTRLSVSYSPSLLLTYVGLILIVGLGAGGWAACRMAASAPAAALARSPQGPRSQGGAATGMVIFQFTASICLMACAAVVQRQVRSLEQWDLGFDSDGVILIDNSGNALGDHYAAFKAAAAAHIGIQDVSSGTIPCFFEGRSLTWTANDTEVRIRDFEVDRGYLQALKIRLISGQDFSGIGDGAAADACVVNEAYTRALPGAGDELARPYGFCKRVIGVVADFPAFSLREPIDPVSILLRPGPHPRVLVRIDPSRQRGAMAHLKATWQQFAPERPFEYTFLSADLSRLYAKDRRLGRLITVFTCLALVIGCLGVLGLAAHAAATRTKEIAVRRVLGASSAGLTWLMTRRFAAVVALSTALSTPIAVYAMQSWLSGFAHRTEIEPGLFLLCGGGTLLLTIATVGTQTLRASLADPVTALRCE